MAIRAEHELHSRRKSRNMGDLLVLLIFIGIVFGLTVVKVRQLGAAQTFDSVTVPGNAPTGGGQ